VNLSNSEAWRFLDDDVAVRAGAANMAVDHALLESVQAGAAPILRFYRWSAPTLSFGRNQPARGIYDQASHVQKVRRPTGGLAVLHDREVTYSVAIPVAALGGPRATYLAINQALLCGLQQLGVPAELSPSLPRSRFGAVQPCFAEPAEGEVVAQGRKLVGSAQRYERRVILQHGSILLSNDQPAGAIGLDELLKTVPAVTEISAALRAAFGAVCGTCLAPAELSRRELERAGQLEELYASESWTWRR
jgi:lipoate-protein ligase A